MGFVRLGKRKEAEEKKPQYAYEHVREEPKEVDFPKPEYPCTIELTGSEDFIAECIRRLNKE